MNSNYDQWKTAVLECSNVAGETPTGEAVSSRANVFDMTHTAEQAVLKPVDSGAWPHALRAALACRIARIHASNELATRYFTMIESASHEPIADLHNDGSDLNLQAVVSFMDQVARQPRDVTAGDVEKLQLAGLDDADIVKLTELNAFMAYQIRLIDGLKLLAGNPA